MELRLLHILCLRAQSRDEMTDTSKEVPEDPPGAEEASDLGFLSQLDQMRQALVGSSVSKALVALVGVIFLVVVVTAY